MILGAITIAIALFSYLPSAWNTVLYILVGLAIIITAYMMKPASVPAKPAAPYIEHTPIIPPAPTAPEISSLTFQAPSALADTNTTPLP
jgi:hypothetical protein